MKPRIGWLTALLTLALISCYEGRGDLNFNTEPTIFRGVWTAQALSDNAPTALRFELNASDVTRNEYTVAGTLTMAGDAPLKVAGWVNGSQSERYLQAPLPPQLYLELSDSGGRLGILKCIWNKNFAEKKCDLTVDSGSRAGLYSVVNMVKP